MKVKFWSLKFVSPRREKFLWAASCDCCGFVDFSRGSCMVISWVMLVFRSVSVVVVVLGVRVRSIFSGRFADVRPRPGL